MTKYFKIHYFLWAMLGGFTISVLPIFFQMMGYDQRQIGYLAAIPSITILCQPIYGMLIDRYNLAKQVAMIGIIGSGIALFFVPYTNNFLMLFIIILIYNLFKAPVFSAGDNIIISYCMRNNLNFGRIRVPASISWGSSILLVYPIIYIFSPDAFFAYNLLVSLFLAIFIVSKFENNTRISEKSILPFKTALKLLFKNKPYLYILVFTFLFASIQPINFMYQSMYLKSLGASGVIIGIAMMVSTLPELFILPYSDILRKYFSNKVLLIIATTCLLIKFICFKYITNIPALIIIASLHGVAFGIYIPLFLRIIKSLVPDQVSTTAIMTNAFIGAISGVISTVLAGQLNYYFGLSNVYYLHIIMMSATLIYLNINGKHFNISTINEN